VCPGRARKPLKRYFNKHFSNYLQDKLDEQLKDDIEKEFHDRAAVMRPNYDFNRGAPP
jgi:hypothetical protein